MLSKVVDFQASLKVSSKREADKFEANTNSKANIEKDDISTCQYVQDNDHGETRSRCLEHKADQIGKWKCS